MFFFILLDLLLCITITYYWIIGSHIYINLDRSYAASSFPGDITFNEKIMYLLFFPATLFGFLCILTLLLYLIFKSIFKDKIIFSKKRVIYSMIIPLICTMYIFIELYIFLFLS